jgi:hypothetical protein
MRKRKVNPYLLEQFMFKAKELPIAMYWLLYFKDANCAFLDQVSNHDHNYSLQN